MRIISERRSGTDHNILTSCILEYGDRLFKICECPTQLYIWSGLNGWLYLDHGDRKNTVKEHIDQFLPIMKVFNNEKEEN